ncbi:hypothetical protein ABTG52_06730, partial [Acinetobacter baumannii]
HHPLDPLTITEVNKVQKVIKSFFKNYVYAVHSLVLEDPDKSVVLTWKRGDELPVRKASVMARAKGRNYLLTVHVESGEVEEHDVSGLSGFPLVTLEDMQKVLYTPLKSAKFNRTVEERGVDLNDVVCLPFSPGWFGKAEEGRRLVKLECFNTQGTANFYMRPIEGIIIITDLDTNEVVEIIDTGKHIPIPKAANTDYRLSAQ